MKSIALDLQKLTSDIQTRISKLQEVLTESSKHLENLAGVNHLECINKLATELEDIKKMKLTKTLILKILGKIFCVQGVPKNFPLFEYTIFLQRYYEEDMTNIMLQKVDLALNKMAIEHESCCLISTNKGFS